MKDDLEALGGRCRRRLIGIERLRCAASIELDIHRLGCTARKKTIVQKFAPVVFEILSARERRKCLPHDLVRTCLAQVSNPGEHFEVCDAAEERFNQRLNRNDGTVRCARVTPAFQIMRLRKMPITDCKRFVLVISEPNNVFCPPLRLGPVEIIGRVIDWIAAKNNERVDLVTGQCLGQLTDVLFFAGSRGLLKNNCATDSTERCVHQCGDQVHRDGLAMTSNNERSISLRHEIFRAFHGPLWLDRRVIR